MRAARAGTAGGRAAPKGVRLAERLLLHADLLRRHPYWQGVYRRVQPLWTFPRQAELRGLQGRVVVGFELDPTDGSVHQLHVVQPSGVPGFDRNVLAAVREAAPFGTVPSGAPRARHVEWPFTFLNPVVR